MFKASRHAAERYIERFDGNLTTERARVERIARNARFKRTAPGNARVYGNGQYDLVVVDNMIVTIYSPGMHDGFIQA